MTYLDLNHPPRTDAGLKCVPTISTGFHRNSSLLFLDLCGVSILCSISTAARTRWKDFRNAQIRLARKLPLESSKMIFDIVR